MPTEYVQKALEFIATMDSEIERITRLSLEAEKDMQHETIPDEIIGKIRCDSTLLVTWSRNVRRPPHICLCPGICLRGCVRPSSPKLLVKKVVDKS